MDATVIYLLLLIYWAGMTLWVVSWPLVNRSRMGLLRDEWCKAAFVWPLFGPWCLLAVVSNTLMLAAMRLASYSERKYLKWKGLI